MLTVPRVHGLRFMTWPNDHAPAHVQVFSADAQATIRLGEPSGHPRLIENRRMRRGDVAKALQAVFEHRSMLQRRWSGIHG